MEKSRISILACGYADTSQVGNFLWTVGQQIVKPLETILVDNASPEPGYEPLKKRFPEVTFVRISPEEKKFRNITQGINIAARMARGEYLCIIADPHVLLSFNLLEEVDRLLAPDTLVLSEGKTIDIRISSDWDCREVQKNRDAESLELIYEMNEKMLVSMGWPCDPMKFNLDKVVWGVRGAHNNDDCFVVALSKKRFLEVGGYAHEEKPTYRDYGRYHADWVKEIRQGMKVERLGNNVRAVHQHHPILKGGTI